MQGQGYPNFSPFLFPSLVSAFIRRGWLPAEQTYGKPVWIGQISRDIGVRFTFKTWPPVTHKIDPDVDEAMYALIEDLVYSQQLAKGGYVKGVGAATRSKPRHNLTDDRCT